MQLNILIGYVALKLIAITVIHFNEEKEPSIGFQKSR